MWLLVADEQQHSKVLLVDGGCATICVMSLLLVNFQSGFTFGCGLWLIRLWLWLLVVYEQQHSKTLLSRRLRDHLCHVIVVCWFSMWLLPLVVVVVVDEVVSC